MRQSSIGKFSKVDDLISEAAGDSTKPGFDSLKVTEAINLNATITETTLIDSYKKLMNTIYLTTLARGINEFTEEQKYWINYVASLCPFEYGPGVYSARTMLILFDTTMYDYENCTGDSYYRLESESVSAKFNLYPNPADETFTLAYQIGEDCDAEFEIKDVAGRTLLKSRLNFSNQKQVFSASGFSSGLYLYSIKCNGNTVKSDKLVIVK